MKCKLTMTGMVGKFNQAQLYLYDKFGSKQSHLYYCRKPHMKVITRNGVEITVTVDNREQYIINSNIRMDNGN